MVVVSTSFISLALLVASVQNAAAAPVAAAASQPSLVARHASAAGKKPMTVPLPAKVMAAKMSKSSKSAPKKTNKPKSKTASTSSSSSKHVEGQHHRDSRTQSSSHSSKHKSHAKHGKSHDKRHKNRLDSASFEDGPAPLVDVQATLFSARDEERLGHRSHDHDHDYDHDHDSHQHHDHDHDGDHHDHDHDHSRRQLLDIDIGHPAAYTQEDQPVAHVASTKSSGKLISVKHGSHAHKVAAADSPASTYYSQSLLDLDVNLKRDHDHDHDHDHDNDSDRHHDHDHDHDGDHHDHDHYHSRRQLLDVEVGHQSNPVAYTQADQPVAHVASTKSNGKLISVKHGSHTHKVVSQAAPPVVAAAAADSPAATYYSGGILDLDLHLKRRGDHVHEHVHDEHDDDDVHEHIHEHHHREEHVHEHEHDRHDRHEHEHKHKHEHRRATKPAVTYAPLFAASKSKGQPLKYVGKKESKGHSKRADLATSGSCPELASAVPGYLQLVTPAAKQADSPVPLANLVLSETPSSTSTFVMSAASNATHATVMMVREGAPDPANNGTIAAKFLVEVFDSSAGSMGCLCASFNPDVASPLTLLPCDADTKTSSVSQQFEFDPATYTVAPLWNDTMAKRSVPPPGTFFAQDGAAENVALPAPASKTASASAADAENTSSSMTPSSTSTSASLSSTFLPPAAAAAKQEVVLAFRPTVDTVIKPVLKSAETKINDSIASAMEKDLSPTALVPDTPECDDSNYDGDEDSDTNADAENGADEESQGNGTPCEENSSIQCSAPEEGESWSSSDESPSPDMTTTTEAEQPSSTELHDKVIGTVADAYVPVPWEHVPQ